MASTNCIGVKKNKTTLTVTTLSSPFQWEISNTAIKKPIPPGNNAVVTRLVVLELGSVLKHFRNILKEVKYHCLYYHHANSIKYII